MSGLKYYQRISYIMELTEKRKTGSPAELAMKLGVTERTVYNIMESLRCTEAGSIQYSRSDRSYIFSNKI